MKFFKKNIDKEKLDEQTILYTYRKTGDIELLAQLYSPYMHLVYGVCFGFLKDDEQSKDAVMEIFEVLISKLKVHQVANFKSWLHVLTRNHCLMILRKSQKNKLESFPDQLMENENLVHLDFNETQEQQLQLMEKCMDTLSLEQKKSVQLFYIEEKCYKEVSEITGYELLKVKSYIQNGKRNLKNCIEKNSEK